MSERKALNKYYPADYDPQEAEKAARKLSKQLKGRSSNIVTVRLMTPFSMRCSKCDEFIARSRKFNAKKEPLAERYLGSVKMFRFTLRCPRCSGSISFRTDPASSDYVMEAGGVRNFEKKVEGGESKPTNETVDETLARLAREQEEEEQEKEKEKDKGKGKTALASGADKMEALEERLVKLQREQESAAEIEALRQASRSRMGKAQSILEERQMQEPAAEDVPDPTAEREVDRLADEAFAQVTGGQGGNAAVVSDAELLSVRELVKKPKIRLGKKGKSKNPLGVVLKKRT